jgi:hypothetical protein
MVDDLDRESLERELTEASIRPSYYHFGGYVEDRVCLHQENGGWSVYYAERGNRNVEKWFRSESDACAYLLELALADETSRQR